MSETLKERPSTRVHAAPGGNSSMASIFGGGEAPSHAAPPRAAPPVQAAIVAPPASGAAPAAGARVVNRSEHTIHEAPSTRVHAAPGGNSSMASIFGAAEPTPTPVPQPAAPPARVEAPAQPAAAPMQLAAGQRVAVRTEHTGISEVPSSRVLAAPGGQSSMAALVGGSTSDRKAALLARRAQLGDATNVV